MAPKKKQQKPKASSSSSKASSSSSNGPKLQLSAENENRLRRLLLNSGRSAPSPAPPQNNLSKEQKVKRLRSVYENLSCDGFKDDQIELALSALMVRNLLLITTLVNPTFLNRTWCNQLTNCSINFLQVVEIFCTSVLGWS